jgi:hypothetical protein
MIAKVRPDGVWRCQPIGRTLGIVRLGTRNVNLELVREGWAWWYRKYSPKNKELASAEEAARKAKQGLWADAKPIPPWDWRKSERERREKSRSDVDTGYWLNTSTGGPSQRNLPVVYIASTQTRDSARTTPLTG